MAVAIFTLFFLWSHISQSVAASEKAEASIICSLGATNFSRIHSLKSYMSFLEPEVGSHIQVVSLRAVSYWVGYIYYFSLSLSLIFCTLILFSMIVVIFFPSVLLGWIFFFPFFFFESFVLFCFSPTEVIDFWQRKRQRTQFTPRVH